MNTRPDNRLPNRSQIGAWSVRLLFLLTLNLANSPVFAATVCPEGPPTCNHATIQDALDNAQNGDVITVTKPGTYFESNLFVNRQNITLKSKDPGARKAYIIDGGGNATVVRMGIGWRLEGFTITGGSAADGGGVVLGGPATIRDCIIRGNTATGGGGGIFNLTGSADLEAFNIQVHGNNARFGGGISTVADLDLRDSQVFDNDAIRAAGPAAFGGGIVVGGELNLERTKVFNNFVIGAGGTAGGVLKNAQSADVRITNSTITGNMVSGSGGGLRINSGAAVITFGSITGNTATTRGGGVELSGGTTDFGLVKINGNMAAIDGGGVYCGGGVISDFSANVSGNSVNDLATSCAACSLGEQQACTTGRTGICTFGVQECNEFGLWGRCIFPGGMAAIPDFAESEEGLQICTDGLDNDCDGLTDIFDPGCYLVPATAGENNQGGEANDPVNTFLGELFHDFQPDINLGGPLPLLFSRYYGSGLSAAGVSGRLGTNFRHNFEWQLTNGGSSVSVVNHRGRLIQFIDNAGSWQLDGQLDVPYQLLSEPGGFVLGDPESQRVYVFDLTGRLTAIQDGNLNTLTLTYTVNDLTQIDDGLGRMLTLAYLNGKLNSVSDGTRSVTFGYDPGNTELVSVTDVRNKVTTFTYDPGGLLTSLTRPRGNVPFMQTWDGMNRVMTQTDAEMNTSGFSYDDPASGDTTISDPPPDMAQRVHTHAQWGGLKTIQDRNGQDVVLHNDGDGRRGVVVDRLGDMTRVEYDPIGGSISDNFRADGTSIHYGYQSYLVRGIEFRRLASVFYPDGSLEVMGYDEAGNRLSHNDRNANTTDFSRNSRGQLLTRTNAAGGITTYNYNGDGTLASRIDHAMNTTTFGYDALRRRNQVTFADGTSKLYAFDNANNVLSITDGRNNTTTFSYDDNGNLATHTDPLMHTRSFGYDNLDRAISVTDALGNAATLTYDSLGRVMTATDRGGDAVNYAYDLRGRVVGVTDGAGHMWPRSWDLESIPESVTDPLGNTVNFTSDSMGRITQRTDPHGHTTLSDYDQSGRLTRITDPIGEVTHLAYDNSGLILGISREGLSTSIVRDELGEITAITDPNGQLWSQAWDDQGRIVSSTDPLNQQRIYTYDNRNRIGSMTLPGGLGTMTPTYDAVDNLTRKLYSDATDLNFTYDAADRLTNAEGLSLTYDVNDRLIQSNDLTMTRDLNGRIATLTLAPGKTLTYSYDPRGLLSQVTDWVGGAEGTTVFTYDNASRLIGITRPNGVDTAYSYDDGSLIATITEGTGATARSSISLIHDDAGRIMRSDRNVPSVADASGTAPISASYDAASQVNGFVYDALGRLTDDGSRSYQWDLASRLTSVTSLPDTVSYTYDALGQRLTRSEAGLTRGFVWNYALGLPSINVERTGGTGGSDLRYYITTPGGQLLYSLEAMDDARRDYHYDQAGNTLFLTDASATVIASYTYGPYGELLVSSGALENAFTWQGRYGVMNEVGSTGVTNGLYYLRARFYDSTTRRFVSRDPLPSIDPATVNPYQYAAAAPTRFVDPIGLRPLSVNTLESFDADLSELEEPIDSVIDELGPYGRAARPPLEEASPYACGRPNNRESVKKALADARKAVETFRDRRTIFEEFLLELRNERQDIENESISLAEAFLLEPLLYRAFGVIPSVPLQTNQEIFEEEASRLESYFGTASFSFETGLADLHSKVRCLEDALDALEDPELEQDSAIPDLAPVIVL